MPDLEWNRAVWDRGYAWTEEGDEWSHAWGGARAQWFGTIYPRISRFLPARRILEIAPGFGRWTQFLLTHCVELIGVDISQKCADHCRQRFASAPGATFFANDGTSLAMVPNESIDLVFSFDSLVHVEIDVIREYVWQIAQKLSTSGIAFVHHSNANASVEYLELARKNARALSVSADRVKELFEDSRCKMLVQEEITWDGPQRIDCLTTICRQGVLDHWVSARIENNEFMTEAYLVRSNLSPYHAIPIERSTRAGGHRQS
jgi:SAM-dependent methyltransferase